MCAKKRGGRSNQSNHSNQSIDQSTSSSEFSQAMSTLGVKPIQPYNQAIHDTPKSPTKVRKDVEDKTPVVKDQISDGYEPNECIQAGDVLSFRDDGIQKKVFYDLRRGRYRIIDELDLHGLTVWQAKTLLLQYLRQAEQFDKTCVKVIHGKGRRSETGEPVLKKKVAYWLRVHQRVLAYYSTLPADGGTGAVYVLLKRFSE